MLELYTLSAPESPVRAWMRWDHRKGMRQTVKHESIVWKNMFRIQVSHCPIMWVFMFTVLGTSAIMQFHSILCSIYLYSHGFDHSYLVTFTHSQPHIFPGCLRSVQIWGSKHTPSWESVCMQSFAVLDGWPGPFQTAESSGRIQKDEPIPQLRWNSGIYCDRWRGYLVTTCCFFRLCKWIKSKNLTIMIWFLFRAPLYTNVLFLWFFGSCPG